MMEDSQGETTDSEPPQSNRIDDKLPDPGPSSGTTRTRILLSLRNLTSVARETVRPPLVRERTLSRNGSISSLSSCKFSCSRFDDPMPKTYAAFSRPTSRQSMNGVEDVEKKRERERGWNHPLGPYIERHRATSPFYSATHSGGFGRIRNASLSSISGSESDANRLSPGHSRRQSDGKCIAPTLLVQGNVEPLFVRAYPFSRSIEICWHRVQSGSVIIAQSNTCD